MYKRRKCLPVIPSIVLVMCIIVAALGLLMTPTVGAQNWAAIPPYNLLWPLWSPVLSPPNAAGIPTPLLPALTRNTILPVQPMVVWDPSPSNASGYIWALYNIPLAFGGGMAFFDKIYGMNPFPPAYLQDPITGAPAPISLLTTYSLLLPTSTTELEWIIPTANVNYALNYGITGADFLNLLTPSQIWGLPPI
ncbi:MAG: hypothetical protein ACMUIS_03855 [bacterium]